MDTIRGKKGNAYIKVRRGGKLDGRFCVSHDSKPAKTPRRGTLKGMTPAAVRMDGCFVSKAKAKSVADRKSKIAFDPARRSNR